VLILQGHWERRAASACPGRQEALPLTNPFCSVPEAGCYE